MLVLFETPAGYALFKVLDEGKLRNIDDLPKEFETSDKAHKFIKLKAFSKFENTAEALAAATALIDGKLSKGLKKFLKTEFLTHFKKSTLAVADSKLGSILKDNYDIQCLHDASVMELFRGIRSQMNSLITGLSEHEMNAMVLGLSHSLSRYKLKFSPDKVDTMIVQAIGLLDDLDKELNTYAMRVKEWYGWHFPELAKMVTDNLAFARVIKVMGFRSMAQECDLSSVLPEELDQEVKEAAQISMGTEMSEEDLDNIGHLCDQVISISEYRTQLYEYLKNRMNAIAPNLTTMVGELVGARLIAHAGSLMNLAKQPASTVQILGAEKALFRALKTKHDTPKYGLIYHASLVGQAPPKLKGKISRVLAAKTALSIRVDALGDKNTVSIGLEARAKVENRLRQLEAYTVHSLGSHRKPKQQETPKYGRQSAAAPKYNDQTDFTLGSPSLTAHKEEPPAAESKKLPEETEPPKKHKKDKTK